MWLLCGLVLLSAVLVKLFVIVVAVKELKSVYIIQDCTGEVGCTISSFIRLSAGEIEWQPYCFAIILLLYVPPNISVLLVFVMFTGLFLRSHSLLWRYIVLLTVGVYSSNHRVLYTIVISMTRQFQESVGPSVRL